jgi:hypothetical protein
MKSMTRRNYGNLIIGAAAGALLPTPLLSSSLPIGSPPTPLTLKLTPLPAQGVQRIASIAIDLHFGSVRAARGAPLLRMALISDNVDTIATTVTDIEATDANGPLTLKVRDIDLPVEEARDSQTGGPTREWFPDRAVSGALEVRYTVPGQATLPPRGPVGPLAFSDDAGGVSANGNIFLLMPPGDQLYAFNVVWDLSHLPGGAIGVSSLGRGSRRSVAPMTSGEIRQSYFMAGRVETWPAEDEASGFFSAWQGTPSFDAAMLLRWTSNLYGHYQQFFHEPPHHPYGVFLRYNPVNSGGGTGFFHSFVATFGPGRGSDLSAMRVMLAHEMFHTFQPYITQPAGKISSWFTEGLAVFYEGRLPLRFGLITPDEFLTDLNTAAGRYYTNIMATQPNSVIGDHFWSDTRIRMLAYDRGMLYFATVDDAMRKKYHGSQSLDDLMLGMLERERHGAKLSNQDWEDMLRAKLGPSAVDEFRKFLAGDMPLPATDAFGPCFERTTTRLRRYELGFDPAVLSEPTRIVRGVVVGSAAERAGLRNGDEIVKPIPQDEIQGNQKEIQTLQIRRGDQVFPISYLPRGETVDAYQWRRKASVTDDRCAV